MRSIEILGIPYLAHGSGIHIKKENRGKFTETKKRTGKTTEELTHSKNPLTRKRAIFALNSRKFKHEDGGSVHKPNGHRSVLDNGWFKTKDLKKNHPLTFGIGGMIPKFLHSGPLFTKETRERMLKSTDEAVDAVKAASKKASDAYEDFSNSPWGTVYDIVNAGLYAAAPFTGGVTLVPAIAMSVGLGIAGANNMYLKGATVNNVADVAGGVLAAPGKMVVKPMMKMVGKTAKYVKRAPLVTKSGKGITATKPLWQMAKENKKYAPYAAYLYGNIGTNIGLIGNDLHDNYQTYVAPWVGYLKLIALAVNKETNKRK